MPYTVGQAAKATGRSKPTISRAIKTGTISATKNDDGSYTIDPAELHRVFPSVSLSGNETPDFLRSVTAASQGTLQREIELLREMLTSKDSVIDDLRERLDREGEERRKLTAILTDQRSTKAPDIIAMPPPTSHSLSGNEVEAPGKVAGNGADAAAARKAARTLKPPPTPKRKRFLGWLGG